MIKARRTTFWRLTLTSAKEAARLYFDPLRRLATRLGRRVPVPRPSARMPSDNPSTVVNTGKRNLDVAIFGAGIAGLITAITLQQSGHRCRIYERARSSQDTEMGFILVPQCIVWFAQFGIDIGGVPLDLYRSRNSAGQVLYEQMMPPGSRAIRRSDLIHALMRSLPTPETIAFSSELVDLQFDYDGFVTAALLYSGERIFSVHADLYVAADGVGSCGRQALFPGWPLPPAQTAEIVGLVHSPKTANVAGKVFNKFYAAEGGVGLGVVPVDAENVIWYLQFDSHRFAVEWDSPLSRRDLAQRLVGGWADPIPHLVANTDLSRVHVWRPVDSDLVPRFHQRNLVLIGDAAHPHLPFTSQGVSSAVEDAVTLAQLISPGRSLDDALAAYSTQRHGECEPSIARGRELQQLFLKPRAAVNWSHSLDSDEIILLR